MAYGSELGSAGGIVRSLGQPQNSEIRIQIPGSYAVAGNQREEQRPQRLLVQDSERHADVELKHDRVRRLLQSASADALLLQEPGNIAWFAGGADVSRCRSDACSTSLFITNEARLFATNAVDSAQIFEREVFGLGFQLKQREWFQPHDDLIMDLCRGRRVVSDSGVFDTVRAGDLIRQERLPLTSLEVNRMRRLSRVATHAVEASAGNVRRGVTEAEVAGEVSHRLLKRTVTPCRIQVAADGRSKRYRHWSFGEDPIQSYAVISCVARRWGLNVGVSRTVFVDDIPQELWAAHQRAVLIHASGIFFSRSQQPLTDVWKRVFRIYEKFGLNNEWQLNDQASVLGYSPCEQQLLPDSDYRITAPSPVFWHPSVGPAQTGDTILVHDSAVERLTTSSSWPQLMVHVKGQPVPAPSLLRVRSGDPAMPSDEESGQSVFDVIDQPQEQEAMSRMDSIWELDLTSNRSVFEEDDSPFSEESVLD